MKWAMYQKKFQEVSCFREYIETGTYIDEIIDKSRIHNALEQWIYMDIVIR